MSAAADGPGKPEPKREVEDPPPHATRNDTRRQPENERNA